MSVISFVTIKKILIELTKQLNDGAPTNQCLLDIKKYIGFYIYDWGCVTHFALIKMRKFFPSTLHEIHYNPWNYEFYGLDINGEFMFDLSLDRLVKDRKITKTLLNDLTKSYPNYYETYINSNVEE